MPIYARDNSSPPEITIRFAPSPGYLTQGDSPTQTGHFGFRIESLPEPEPPAGYIFIGWFASGTQVHAPVAAIRNTTILAAYAPIPDPYCTNRFAILYDTGLGHLPQGAPPIQALPYGSAITSLPEPTKEGYSFGGWTWNDEAISAPIIVRDDMVLEALWVQGPARQPSQPTTYPIAIPTFNLVTAFNPFPGVFNGDEIGIRFVRSSNNLRNIPENPTRSDAVFVGWQLPNGELLDSQLLVRQDMMLTAIWDTCEYAVAGLYPNAPVETRPNPQTSPFTISLIFYSAVITLGVSVLGIMHLRQKQARAVVRYRSGVVRQIREARMVIKNRGKQGNIREEW